VKEKDYNSMLSQINCTGRDQGELGCNTRWPSVWPIRNKLQGWITIML